MIFNFLKVESLIFVLMKKRNINNKKSIRKNRSRKKSIGRKYFFWAFLVGIVFFVGFYFKNSVHFYYAKYFLKRENIHLRNSPQEEKRINTIVEYYRDKTFGIDISHYQRRQDIDWDSLSIANGAIPIDFVVLRASMGQNGKDKNFDYFWEKAKESGKIRGAYHFYRPDENPILQANNFLSRVKLESGDLPPILDIEKPPRGKTKEELVRDLKIWCDIVEQKYGKKPILYTYYHYYKDYLRDDFSGYVLWLANYNNVLEPSEEDDWDFWQFTEKGIVNGINTKVDVDIYNGSLRSLKRLTIDN